MSTIFTITPSPHIHQGDSVKKIMYSVVFALLPALIWSFFVFGLSAVVLTMVSVATCIISEYFLQKYLLKTTPTITDGSALITGILLAMNVPSGLPIWMMALGALFSIGIAKMTFGGLGNNPFNPALIGRVFLLISFPVQMTTWPIAGSIDGSTGATPLGLIKEGLKTGKSISELTNELPSYSDLFFGNMGGSLGEISALLLRLGFGYMLFRKVVTWHIPIAVLGSIFIFTGILWLINPAVYINPIYHILTGGAMLGAIFMATDMVTSPLSFKERFIFGLGCGFLTFVIRRYGNLPEGVSLAIILMNILVPLIDRYTRPGRYGVSS